MSSINLGATTQTQILNGIVNPDDTSGLFQASSNNRMYTDYLIRCKYEKDRHRYVLGLTSPNGFNGKSCAVVQLAKPTLILIVDWTAASLGDEPELPNPDSMDSNWVLLDDFWEPNEVVWSADGITPLYRISGTYFYVHTNPDDKTYNNVSFPRPPWEIDNVTRVISASQLVNNLVVVAGSTAGAKTPAQFGNIKG